MTDTLRLVVLTQNLATGGVTKKVIDHEDRADRIWLGRHCFWAFRNGRAVITYNYDDTDQPLWLVDRLEPIEEEDEADAEH